MTMLETLAQIDAAAADAFAQARAHAQCTNKVSEIYVWNAKARAYAHAADILRGYAPDARSTDPNAVPGKPQNISQGENPSPQHRRENAG